jgi:hypothetical protein
MGMTPDQVAPVAVYLAHEQCSLSARHLQSYAGHVDELYLAQRSGTTNAELSAEDVERELEQILDRADGTPVPDPLDGAASPFTRQALRLAGLRARTVADAVHI